MPHWLERTALLIGQEKLNLLQQKHILIVGLGGVGSYAAEALVRAGIGSITIIDGDSVDPTNKNRQLQALDSSIGLNKAQLLKERFLDINSSITVNEIQSFIDPNQMSELISNGSFDFVLDCIDSIQPKLSLILTARRLKTKFISSMGAGGKIDPSKIKVADISKTTECKFAQEIRKKLRKVGVIDNVLTVFCQEIQPSIALEMTNGSLFKKSYYGTISYMPAMMGMTMAAEVIKRLALLK